jgi:hypothetical protein
VAVAALALAYCAQSFYFGITLPRPLPSVDEWVFIDLDLFRYFDGRYSFLDLFAQTNEHRVFTARLVLFADALWFGMRGIFPILISYGALAGIAALLTALASGISAVERIAVFCVALAILWSTSQFMNLSSPFQVVFPFVHLFALILFWAFDQAALSQGRRRAAFFVLAVVMDFLAVFSIGSGVLVVLPLAALAIWIRSGARLLAAILAFHAVLLAAYFWTYTPAHSPHGFESWNHWSSLVSVGLAMPFGPSAEHWDYFANNILPLVGISYFSSTWPSATYVVVGKIAAAVIVAVVVLLTWNTLRRRAIDNGTAIFAALASFAAIEVLVAAYTRGGMANRHMTVAVVFLAALGGLLWRVAKPWPLARAAVAALAILTVIESNHPAWTAAWQSQSEEQSRMLDEVRRGPLSAETARAVFGPGNLQGDMDRLRELKIGPFAR